MDNTNEKRVGNNEPNKNVELIAVAEGEKIISKRVKAEINKFEEEIKTNSAISAIIIGIVCTNTLTFIEKIPLSGDYKYLWATLIGIFTGAVFGKNVMLIVLGVTIGFKLAAL